MVATIKSIEETKRRTIIALASNGANVRAWEAGFLSALQIEGQSHFMVADYSRSVPAHKTLALSVEVQVGRAIKAGRTKYAAQKALDEALLKEVFPVSSVTPRVALEAGTPGEKQKPAGSVTRSKTEKAAADEGKSEGEVAADAKVAAEAEAAAEAQDAEVKEAFRVKEAADAMDFHQGKVQEGKAHARVVREAKMRARGEAMAERLAAAQGAVAERRGGQLMVSFLDPLSALDLNDETDRESVCHVHTFMGETLRYAVETSEHAQVRMRIDAMLTRSLTDIPAHITTGVEPGNIYERYKRVVVYFDDITRKVLMEDIDSDLHELRMRERESFASFTSRFKGIEHRMQEVGLVQDPELLLSKLEKALRASKNAGVHAVLKQVKLVVGLVLSDTKDLLSAMAEPMRDYEKEHKVGQEKVKAAQEKVNALHASQRGKGGKGDKGGKGGKGDKGGKGAASKSPCLRFAESTCSFPNCRFAHVALSAEAIAELKAKMAKAKTARKAGGGTTPQRKRSGGVHTVVEVTNALKAEVTAEVPLIDKIKGLREQGLTEEQILTVANALLGKQ